MKAASLHLSAGEPRRASSKAAYRTSITQLLAAGVGDAGRVSGSFIWVMFLKGRESTCRSPAAGKR